MTVASFQNFGPLPEATEAALRASIARFGVLMPVAIDQHGRVLDGHHRRRIAADLKHACPTKIIHVKDDEHARAIAHTLNADRRHLPPEQRRPMVADLREDGHSVRAIADALGVPKSTVQDDLNQLSGSGQLEETPNRVKGLDGKSRPAKPRRGKAEKSKQQGDSKKPTLPARAVQESAEVLKLRARVAELEDERDNLRDTARELNDQLSALEIKDAGEQQQEILRLRKENARLEAEIVRLRGARNDLQTKCNELIRQVKGLQRKTKEAA